VVGHGNVGADCQLGRQALFGESVVIGRRVRRTIQVAYSEGGSAAAGHRRSSKLAAMTTK